MARFAQYAPDYQVQINGDALPPAMRASVIRVSYHDGLEGADRVEIALANEDLRWLDHPLLQMDNGLSLSIGYRPDPLEEVFVGEITGVDASFPNSGMPTLTIVAHDFLQRLTTGTKDRAFELNLPCIGKFPIPDPAIVSLVGAENLLIPYPDPVGSALSFLTLLVSYAINPLEAKKAVRMQQGQSDFDFLSTLARENGWEMYIDHTSQPKGYVLRFKFLIVDFVPALTLKWGESLMDFTPKISTVGQVVGVSTRLWLSSIKTEFLIILAWDYDRAAFDLKVFPRVGGSDNAGGAKKAKGVLNIQTEGPATAPKKILSELLPRLNNRLTGSGSTIGDLRIKAAEVINLEGLGGQFSGLYRVTSATHTIDSGGYKTAFEVRREVWFDTFGSIPVPKGIGGLGRVQGQKVA